MLRSAIDRILELARPIIVTANGEEYSTVNLNKINKEMIAEPLQVSTLSSFVQYVLKFKEDVKMLPYLVHVIDPTTVRLISALDRDRERETLIIARATTPRITFGSFIDNESMLIAVQSAFVDDPETDRAAILKFAGTVTAGSIKEYGDDGVTQKAIIKTGVASVAEAIVPSPCVLRPFRTFSEVEQPESQFIFRMKEGGGKGILSALYEADGGAWRNVARANIRAYLEKELGGTGVIVIA